MKNTLIKIVSIILLLSLTTTAFALNQDKDKNRSSNYLSSYGVLLSQGTNHQLCISVDIEGVRLMTRIGLFEVYIEEYSEVYGGWTEYDVWYGSNNMSTFYEYNSYDYVNQFYFAGTPGNQYRVTITAFAMDGTGSDTGTVTSVVRTCP